MSTDPAEEARLLAIAVGDRLKSVLAEGEVLRATALAGVPFDQIARLRRGETANPTLRTLVMAARAAGVQVAELLATDEPIARPEPAADDRPSRRQLDEVVRLLDMARAALVSEGDSPDELIRAEAEMDRAEADRERMRESEKGSAGRVG